jgi:hypothetical protein
MQASSTLPGWVILDEIVTLLLGSAIHHDRGRRRGRSLFYYFGQDRYFELLFHEIHHGKGRRNPPRLGLGVLVSLIFWAFFKGILGIKILFCRMEGKNGRKGVINLG